MDASGTIRQNWPLPLPFLAVDAKLIRSIASRLTGTSVTEGVQTANIPMAALSVDIAISEEEKDWEVLGTCNPDNQGVLKVSLSTIEGCSAGWLLISRDIRRTVGRGARLVVEIRRASKVSGVWRSCVKYW